MLPGHGTACGTADGVVNIRPRRLFGRSSERKNPLNVQFERQVARLESKQQQRCIILTVIPFSFCCDFKLPSLAEDGSDQPSSEPTSPGGSFEPSSSSPSSSPIILFHVNIPDVSHRRWPDNTSRLLEEKYTTSNSMPNSDFLVNNFTKPSVNARHTSRRKSKKKSKKHRQRCRKPTDGSEIKCRDSNSVSPSIDVGDCEDLTLSPKHVGDIHFEETFSPSSSVKEASEEAPETENDNEYHCCSGASVSSASYCEETELSGSVTSCRGLFGQHNNSNFRYLDNAPNSVFTGSSQETCYAGASVNCSHDAKTLLIFRNECGPDLCEVRACCSSSSSSGVDENWLEKSDYGSGICQNGVGTCNGAQSVHLCSDTSSDSDFHLVISRKRAIKEKKMSLWKSYGECSSTVTHGRNEKYVGRSSRQMTKELNPEGWSRGQNHVGSIQPPHVGVSKHSTKNFIHRPSNVCTETRNGVPLKDSKLGASLNHLTSLMENSCGKSTNGFNKVQHVYSNIKVSDAVHSRESYHCEMRSNSSSELTTPKPSKGNFASESGESTYHTAGALLTQKRGLQDSVQINHASGTISLLSSPGSKSTLTDTVITCGKVPSVEENRDCRAYRVFSDSGMHLVEMIKVVNDAYKVQVAADVHLAAGYPITDLERFIYSATPVIDHVPYMRRVYCQNDFSNISLRSIWEWYEEPGCYGLEVRALSDLSSKTSCSNSSEFFAYFVPYLSAIQLFGWSRKDINNSFGIQGGEYLKASSTASSLSSHPVDAKLHKPFEEKFSEASFSIEDCGELLFEYFETEQPSFRPPLFEKIKELVSGANVSDHRILGDPENLQNLKFCDLHPASWFCVAWYPVYRVPRGNFRAAFLTYHSLGKLVSQKCFPDMSGGHSRIVSPVVGLQSYNDKGEHWFELRCPDVKQSASCAEVAKERLRTLKMGALAMARAVIPKGTGESVNHHPDYEFFLSRCT